MTSSSRKARRDLAKKMGFLKKKTSVSEWMQRVSRSVEMGKKIHIQTIERQVNMEINQEKIERIKNLTKESSFDQSLYHIPEISPEILNNSLSSDNDRSSEQSDSEGPVSSSI
jgi:hypothetical protein